MELPARSYGTHGSSLRDLPRLPFGLAPAGDRLPGHPPAQVGPEPGPEPGAGPGPGAGG
jgi:hypothetical protein